MIHKLVSINSIIMKNPFTREPLNRCHVHHARPVFGLAGGAPAPQTPPKSRPPASPKPAKKNQKHIKKMLKNSYQEYPLPLLEFLQLYQHRQRLNVQILLHQIHRLQMPMFLYFLLSLSDNYQHFLK